MTSAVTVFRRALAEHLTMIFDDVPVTAHPPSTPRSSTGFLRPSPTRRWLDYKADGATWCVPVVALDLVLIAPPLPVHVDAADWFEAAAELLAAAAREAPTMSNGRRMPAVASWGPPGLLDAGQGLMAVEVEFMPVPIRSS